jgi:hypothetical protein
MPAIGRQGGFHPASGAVLADDDKSQVFDIPARLFHLVEGAKHLFRFRRGKEPSIIQLTKLLCRVSGDPPKRIIKKGKLAVEVDFVIAVFDIFNDGTVLFLTAG